MTLDKQLRDFERHLRHVNPDVHLNFDPPADSKGTWWLDLKCNNKIVTLEYVPKKGFSLYHPSKDGYGMKPSEFLKTPELAARRVAIFFKSSSSQPGLKLGELRKLMKQTQAELGAKSGVGQAAISKAEKTGVHRTATIRKTINALGGEIEILARFPNATIPLIVDVEM